ncbi:MAG: diaminopimelate decarboxylase, partial [Synergistaceae bacterium]|nr:diaminopimelate decarboxylase [Synergistaceae bacterium]
MNSSSLTPNSSPLTPHSLKWGGVDCQQLAEEFGTPLYVFDTGIIRARCRELRETFLERWDNTVVRYASKAFLIKEMARLINSEGLGLDVVSLGELYTALQAGFPPENIEMNGNAKSREEISMAVNSGVGRIIIDHPDELKTIEHFAHEKGIRQKILIRVAPGVDAHTHAYIATGQSDSKFGFPVDISEGSMLASALRYAMNSEDLDLRGLHFHVDSQLFDPEDNVKALEKTIELMKKLKDSFGFITRELNCGGGFGAVINPSVPSVKCAAFMDPMMELLHADCKKYDLEIPKVIIEPGRWVISEAGITLYRVENIKHLRAGTPADPVELTYVAVDGGMAD